MRSLSTAHEGVWLQPGSTAPSGSRQVTTSQGHVVLEEDASWDGSIESFWYHGVLVEIGVGTNPNLAKAIFNSIGFTPHEPDTPVTGVCARLTHPVVMPTPERLATPLVLEQGEVTLDPPLPSDQATASALRRGTRAAPSSPTSVTGSSLRGTRTRCQLGRTRMAPSRHSITTSLTGWSTRHP